MNWNDANMTDEELAQLPWWETQDTFVVGGVIVGTGRVATVGWHGTDWDPMIPAFAIVNPDGPLASFVGERLRVSAGKRAVYVYCHDESQIVEHLSLTRRAFMALASPAQEDLVAFVEVMA